MSGTAQRRHRILAVRVRQARIAQASLADAHRQLDKLELTATQLARMADNLGAANGETNALHLRTLGEFGTRLRTAAQQLATPIANARTKCAQRLTARLIADQKENGASQLAERATRDDDRTQDLRVQASRPFRPRKSWLEPAE